MSLTVARPSERIAINQWQVQTFVRRNVDGRKHSWQILDDDDDAIILLIKWTKCEVQVSLSIMNVYPLVVNALFHGGWGTSRSMNVALFYNPF